MIRVEQYKLFHNSKDFELLIKKSKKEILDHGADYQIFLKKYIPKIKENKHAVILYVDSKPIGYEFMIISRRKADDCFTYIVPEYRNKGYGTLLRKHCFKMFWNEYDEISGSIKNKNIGSKKSILKIAKEFGLNVKIDVEINEKGEKIELTKLTK